MTLILPLSCHTTRRCRRQTDIAMLPLLMGELQMLLHTTISQIWWSQLPNRRTAMITPNSVSCFAAWSIIVTIVSWRCHTMTLLLSKRSISRASDACHVSIRHRDGVLWWSEAKCFCAVISSVRVRQLCRLRSCLEVVTKHSLWSTQSSRNFATPNGRASTACQLQIERSQLLDGRTSTIK